MGKVIENGQVVEDTWQRIAVEDDVPASGNIFVSLEAWQSQQEALTSREGQVGIWVNGEVDFDALVEASQSVSAIALHFDKFADGRSYSHAYLLRTRHGFEGQLRATGDILRDQMFYYQRVGFDVLEVREDKDVEAAVASLSDFSVKYQPSADGQAPVYANARPDA